MMAFTEDPPATPEPTSTELAAPFLFSPEIIASITEEEAKCIYTAERCPEEKRKAIIELLGRSMPKNRIAHILSVDKRTITAVEERWPEEVEHGRQRTVRRFRRAVHDQLDRVEENPTIIPPSAIGLFIAQLTDKAELLDGRATSRVEEVHHVDVFSDWEGFIEKQLAPENVREIYPTGSSKELSTPGMGLVGEKTPPLKQSGSVIDAELVQSEKSRRSETDLQSDDRQVIDEGSKTNIPTLIPESKTPDVRKRAGGGSRTAGGGELLDW